MAAHKASVDIMLFDLRKQVVTDFIARHSGKAAGSLVELGHSWDAVITMLPDGSTPGGTWRKLRRWLLAIPGVRSGADRYARGEAGRVRRWLSLRAVHGRCRQAMCNGCNHLLEKKVIRHVVLTRKFAGGMIMRLIVKDVGIATVLAKRTGIVPPMGDKCLPGWNFKTDLLGGAACGPDYVACPLYMRRNRWVTPFSRSP